MANSRYPANIHCCLLCTNFSLFFVLTVFWFCFDFFLAKMEDNEAYVSPTKAQSLQEPINSCMNLRSHLARIDICWFSSGKTFPLSHSPWFCSAFINKNQICCRSSFVWDLTFIEYLFVVGTGKVLLQYFNNTTLHGCLKAQNNEKHVQVIECK